MFDFSSRQIVLVGGVNGVGKTTMCAQAALTTAFTHLTASQLIKAFNPMAQPRHTQDEADFVARQNVLLQALNANPARHILLDGHFTVRHANGQISPHDPRILEMMQPVLMVVLKDKPAAIAQRLMARDGNAASVEVIAQHQQAELACALQMSRRLKVPYAELVTGQDPAPVLRAGMYAVTMPGLRRFASGLR